MSRTNGTKYRLLSAVLVLVMLISTLVGATYAWFTAQVSSTGNKIEAGTLKIDLWHLSNGTWVSLKENTKHTILNYDKWEPGYTRVETLKIENQGTLALQYKLALEVAYKSEVIGPNGERLADVIDVYITTTEGNETSWSEITANKNWQNKGTLSQVFASADNFFGGNLLSKKDQTLRIALHMQETAGNEYKNLSVGNVFASLVATQLPEESDSFDPDYDQDATLPGFSGSAVASVLVDLDDNNRTTQPITVTGEKGIQMTLPAGTLMTSNRATLNINEMLTTGSNIQVQEGEVRRSYDIHVDGVDPNNTTPVVIAIPEFTAKGMNLGNYDLYHVENGTTNTMTQNATEAHNTYVYDPATGDVVIALATFSEVAVIADTTKAWEGNFDYSWYDASKTEFIIANADQLAAFGAIVGGMKKVTGRVDNEYSYSEEVIQDSFAGKTIKLIADINLGDEEDENNSNIIFYPIGYYNSEGTYERTNTAITSGLKNFEGTFDGNGHTVSNFYHNTWEMKGDHNWYSPEEQYYRDGMGLFGRVYGGTVKNLTVKNFSSDGEIATTGVIAAYADFGATFENIAIFNCNPRVYNIGNGGIVGCVGWYTRDEYPENERDDYKVTFKNITVDNSNKISALWGSYDVACGGIVGQYYPTSGQSSANYPVNAGIEFTNCHISAQMDVYNDVCANYQYYAYRYTGMLIGSVRENVTIDGRSYPKMDGITASGCTVHFGDWNDYYYCELVANTTASYTHDHQMSRLEQVASVDVENMTVTSLDGDTTDIPTSGRVNYVVVKAKDENGQWIHGDGHDYAECYHFVDGAVWDHEDAGYHNGENGEKFIDENGDGDADLKEDKQLIYREFNNLVTGYGWGVTSKGLTDFVGVENMDITEGHENSVVKFAGKVTELSNGVAITLGDIFNFVNNGVELIPGALSVSVHNLDENNPVSATINYDRSNWENGTITFTGTGEVKITIQDYYFCTPTTIEVTINERQSVEKFDVVMNNGDFLHRVGNSGTVALDKLFKAKDGVTVGTVSVTVEAVNDTGASGTYSDNAIQFNGTGVVKVSITDNDYCTPTELYLEVVDAKNYSGKTGESLDATSNNVVLLCNISSGFIVSGRYAVYGNGFTLNYTGNGQYLNNGLKQGIVTVSENGTLDNLHIKASIYPSAYLYYSEAKGGPADDSGTRYYYQLSAVVAKGNATISNCYIYGGRNNIFVDTGNVTIKDTVLECGTLANVQIQSSSDYTVTFENVTTIQHRVNATIGDTTQVMLGAGIIVGPETTTNPTIVLNGDFKQYNWVNAEDKDAVTNDTAKSIIQAALEATAFNHTVNGKTASNLGIIYMNTVSVTVTNNTGLPYVKDTISMTVSGVNISGQVYSLQGATESQIYSDYVSADKSTVNGLYVPQFKYDETLGGQYIAEGGDEHCYREGDTIKVLFPSGDSKEIDLAALVNIVKYGGQDLGLVVTCKDENGNAVTVTDGKITLSAAGEYTVTYTVTDTLFFDKDGKQIINANPIKHSWDVTISVSLKDTAVPDAYFDFVTDNQKMGYYVKSSFLSTSVYQYLPFLAGLQIYDYNGQTAYLRFDGDNDFNKVASIEVTNKYSGNDALIVVKLTDGGVITLQLLARADSGGGSTYTGSIKTSGNTIYFVNDGTTSESEKTTTAAYWYVDYYKFTGNNGVEITSTQQTFNSSGSSASTPSGSFSTTINYTVTYDKNGGNCGQTTGYATSVAAAVTLPTPTRSGYIFAGWYTAASGGTRVGGAGESYTPSANITLYAQWGQPCTVTYNANGGTCGTASEKYTGNALTLPTPTRDGYWFVGWYDAAEGGNKIGDAGATYNPTGDITLYAQWQEQIEYTVTYNANGGSCGTASEKYTGTAMTLPTPTRTGYKFLGWYTAASGGNKIGDAGASYIPEENITLYAQWIEQYTVTYNANSGSVSPSSATVDKGSSVILPNPTRSGYTFNGWYTASSGGTKAGDANASYTPSASITLYAQWTEESSGTDTCLAAGTLITLADGSKKAVEDLRKGDLVMAFDHLTGQIVYKDVIIVVKTAADNYYKNTFIFDDGTELVTINEHGIFDLDLNKYVNIDHLNYEEYIGHRFVSIDTNGNLGVKTLVDVTTIRESGYKYDIVTNGTLNYVAEDTLSVTHVLVDVINSFDFGENLMYDQEKMAADIEKYGLYTYDEWEEYCDISVFDQYNIPVMKVGISKGLYTKEYIIGLINTYVLDDSVQIID